MKPIVGFTNVHSRTVQQKDFKITKILSCGRNRNKQLCREDENTDELAPMLLPFSIQITSLYKTKGIFLICQTSKPDTLLIVSDIVFSGSTKADSTLSLHLLKVAANIKYAEGGLEFLAIQTVDDNIHFITRNLHVVKRVKGVQYIECSYEALFIKLENGTVLAMSERVPEVAKPAFLTFPKVEHLFMGPNHGYITIEHSNTLHSIPGNPERHERLASEDVTLPLLAGEKLLQMEVGYDTSLVLTNTHRMFFIDRSEDCYEYLFDRGELQLPSMSISWLESGVNNTFMYVTTNQTLKVIGTNANGEAGVGNQKTVDNWTDITYSVNKHKKSHEQIVQVVIAGWSSFVAIGEQARVLFENTKKLQKFVDLRIQTG